MREVKYFGKKKQMLEWWSVLNNKNTNDTLNDKIKISLVFFFEKEKISLLVQQSNVSLFI